MAKKMKTRIVMGDERVCPECKTGPIYDMGLYAYCSAEGPHPGGVFIYGDRAVRADRHVQRKANG